MRIAYQSLAAVLGGTQTLATSAFDEAIQLPSDESVRVALRTQQILAYETDAARSADPLGGSYLVESLTTDLEQAIGDYLARIEEQGGSLAALESGWIHKEIEESAYQIHTEIESGERVVVGVNSFVREDEEVELRQRHRIAAGVESDQLALLEKVRAKRDDAAVTMALAELRDAAAGTDNTVAPLVAALRARTSIGEICRVLHDVWD